MNRRVTAPLVPLVWSRTFPAADVHVREARQFLHRLFGNHPAIDDAILCVSEMATNAAIHSRSREPGGKFTVNGMLCGSRIRVEVRDQGGEWIHVLGRERRGHGLHIISQLATEWGIFGDSETGWIVWAEIDPPAERFDRVQK